MDSFKGSLTSRQAGEACAEGIRKELPDALVDVVCVGDGGEGTAEAVVSSLRGSYVDVEVRGPLDEPVTARYGISGDGSTAVMEMASASGLTLVPRRRRNPLYTGTAGTGQMIADALRRGCTTILIGIGGSATNDGGMGMLHALGAVFRDAAGNILRPCGASLEKIALIDLDGLMPQARAARFLVACDVNNPLYGPRGAAYVFAPQKGADENTVERLDAGLRHYASVMSRALGRDVSSMPGAGAAGGLGYAFAACLNSELKPGIELVLDVLKFDSRIVGSAMIFTGEGCTDRQTLMGKTAYGVLRRAMRAKITAVVLAGAVADTDALLDAGFTAVLPVVPGPVSLENAMDAEAAKQNIQRTARMAVRLALSKINNDI